MLPVTEHTLDVVVPKVIALPEAPPVAERLDVPPTVPVDGEAENPVMVCVLPGVTLLDAAEASPIPLPLTAVTVNVYAVPLDRPVTAHVVAVVVVQVFAGSCTALTVYPVMADPQVPAGAVHETEADVGDATVATTPVEPPKAAVVNVWSVPSVLGAHVSPVNL